MLFCAKDVAVALGYKNPRDAINRHCRYVVKRDVPHPQAPDKSIEMFFIPEGDVYRLIVRSDLPSAEKFERWVFDEVLPSIRKTGMYIPNATASPYDVSALSPSLQMATTLLKNANILLETMARTELEQKRQAEEQARQAAEQERIAQEQARQAEEQKRMAQEQTRQAQEQEQHTEALKTVDQKLEDIRDVVVVHPEAWRKKCLHLVAAIAQKRGGDSKAYQDTNIEIFNLVDQRAHVSLQTRLTNRLNRMKAEGVGKSKQKKLNKIDIIAEDNKLIEIYIAIIKEMCVKYEVSPSILEEAQSA